MKTMEITTENNAVIRAQTRPSGDIEIVSCRTKQDGWDGKYVKAGGVIDTLLAVVPKNKRCELAEFLSGV